jgi:hypothetical protein
LPVEWGDVLPASCGDLERAFNVVLSFDLTEACGDEERFEHIIAAGSIRLKYTSTR